MTNVDLYELKEELVVFLRNQNIISTANRGVTTTTDTGTYTNATTDTLNQSYPKNVRSIVVGGNTLSFGTDYSINYSTGVITYTVAQTGAFTISYDYGTTDKIFSDFPQTNLKLSAFPRIAVEVISGQINDVNIGATTTEHSYDITVVCYSIDTKQLEDMITNTINAFLNNKKNFYYVPYIEPGPIGPTLNSPGKENKVLQRNVDFKARFAFKTI